MNDPKLRELRPEQLKWTCEDGDLPSLDDSVNQLAILIGQERARDAFAVGLTVDNPHFNLYVSGLDGVGESGMLRQVIEKFANKKGKEISDIAYVNNFKDPHKPKWLKFKAGQGTVFKKSMEKMIEELKEEIPSALSSPGYVSQAQAIEESLKQFEMTLIEPIRLDANKYGMALGPDASGTALGIGILMKDAQGLFVETILDSILGQPKPQAAKPQSANGAKGQTMKDSVYTPQDIQQMKDVQKELTIELKKASKLLEAEKAKAKENRDKIKKKVVETILSSKIDTIKLQYHSASHPNEKVAQHLEEVKEDILTRLKAFEKKQHDQKCGSASEGGIMAMLGGGGCGSHENLMDVYLVNLIVDRIGAEGRPVVVDGNPHFKNLVGHIGKEVTPTGGIVADFRDIVAGSIAHADGGVLVADVYSVHQHPQSWDAIKRVLKTGMLQVEDIYETIGLERLSSNIKPEALPVDIKVIITGDERAYHALMEYDPDFRDLFNVKVQFDSTIINDKEGRQGYLEFLKSVARKNKFVASSDTLAALLEYGATAAGSQVRLSADFGDLEAVLIEAKNLARPRVETGVSTSPYKVVAGQYGKDVAEATLTRKDLETAVEGRLRRNNLFQEKKQKIIKDSLFLISTEGKEVGQINGLAVYSMPEYMFGVPNRIITTTSVGCEGIISLDRAVDMTGPIHDKGVETIAAYLGDKFGQDKEISLTASIGFEQCYDGIEGDSASSTELYTLLSALSGVPIKQGLAVTGSVNKKGEVQVIGAVNSKIEGWYDICKAKGLTGEQGVLIPEKNMKDLMLKKEVIDAVADGKFHIYPVRTIDEGIEILTGVKAGERVNKKGQPDPEGDYPEDTIFGKVDEKIIDYNYYASQKPEAPKKRKGHLW